nr:translation initiation factor 2 [Cyanidioschyzonaceae sp. 1]
MYANFIRKRSRSTNRMDKCDIILPVGANVTDLAKQTQIPITELIRYVFTQGRIITLNDILDDELMQLFQAKYGFNWQWQWSNQDNKNEDEEDVEIALTAVEKLDAAVIWSNQVWSIAKVDETFVIQMPKLKPLANLTKQIVDKDIHHPKGASMIVVEAKRDNKLGIITTILIRKSTLKIGDTINGSKVRALWNHNKTAIKEAKAGEIVNVMGLNQVLCLGTALNKGKKKSKPNRIQDLCHPKGNLIIRSEYQSGLELVCYFLLDAKWELLSAEVGGIRMQDVKLAENTNSILVAWQTSIMTSIPSHVKIVEAQNFEQLLAGLHSFFEQTTITSKAVVKQIFRNGTIAGCVVTKGSFQVGMECEIWRGNELKTKARISEIKIHKQEVKEVKISQECGIYIKEWIDWQVGDEIVYYS